MLSAYPAVSRTAAIHLTETHTAAAPQRSAPLDLRWDSPGETRFWARAEVPSRNPGDPALRGIASAGFRHPLALCAGQGPFSCDRLRVTFGSLFRSVPDAPLGRGRQGPALGVALTQDAVLEIAPGLRLRGGVAIGDRLGVSARLAPGGAGIAVKARAGVGLDLAELGAGVPVRLDLAVAVTQDLGDAAEGRRAEDCTGSLDIKVADYVPVRLTASCDPTRRGGRIGIGLRGVF